MINYVTKRELHRAEETMSKLGKAYDKLNSIDSITGEISKVKSDLEGSILNCVRKIEFNSKMKNLENRMEKLTNEMNLIHLKNSRTDKSMEKLEALIWNRVTTSDFKYEINDIVNKYAKRSELQELSDQALREVRCLISA
jgi:hypothetical protein